MKTRLLKKLRRTFVIEVRNSEYRVVDKEEKSGGVTDYTDWGSLEEALCSRRRMVLFEARKYKEAKRVLNP